jgi:hypothetical protein
VRKSRFSEDQIIAILKESEAGVETGELCRRHGIAKACFYRWKSKFGGLELSEARRLRQYSKLGFSSPDRLMIQRSKPFGLPTWGCISTPVACFTDSCESRKSAQSN